MSQSVTIIGAGPVGLAAALFLHERGQRARILEKRLEPARESKALAVSPRTLELLEPCGITQRMLALGLKIEHAQLWRGSGASVAEIDLHDLPSKFPFMLALSQAVTERLLAEALAERGVRVERGRSVTGVEKGGKGARLRLLDGEIVESDFALGADGARSKVRESLGIPFDGNSLPGSWHLVDVRLETDLAPDRAHIFFGDKGGFYFAIRVVEDRNQEDGLLWRLISANPDVLRAFPRGRPLAPPTWESSFHISHRLGRALSRGAVFLAGDAAHLHSPVGARGMNLGIEDAFVFADLLARGRLEEYAERRRKVDRTVVRRVDRLSRLALGEGVALRAFRDLFLPVALHSPFVSGFVKRSLSGLDHEVA